MTKEITGAREKTLQDLKLKESDIFRSTEPPIFTKLGSRLYGLFVIHKNDIEEAQRDGTSDKRLGEMTNIETEKKLDDVKKEWEKQIPEGAFVIECAEKHFLEILGKHRL